MRLFGGINEDAASEGGVGASTADAEHGGVKSVVARSGTVLILAGLDNPSSSSFSQ